MNRDTKKKVTLLIGIGILVWFADQSTKFLAIKYLTQSLTQEPAVSTNFWNDLARFFNSSHPIPTGPYQVVHNFWDFQYVENPGAAWSVLSNASESFRGPFFLLVSVIAVALILFYYFRSSSSFVLRRIALAIVFGGAAGNFFDRIRLHYVIDFIEWHYKEVYYWPTFNVADAAITIGVGLLIIESFFTEEAKVSAIHV